MATRDDHNERNRGQRERLKGLRRLSDAELMLPLGEQWTVATALAHLQYWDGRALGAIEAWRRYGVPLTFWDTTELLLVNDARLRYWRALPPREALEQAIATAEALDGVIAALTPAEAEAVAAGRANMLERATHRNTHLTEVEQALSKQT